MIRIIKILFLLAVIGFVGLTGYAYLGDLKPEQRDKTVEVPLDG